MARLFIITGASGHLGGTLLRMLRRTDAEVRALRLPTEPERVSGSNIRWYAGDVCDRDSLAPLFEGAAGATVIHAAGIVSIADQPTPAMLAVNVGGTENMLALAREAGVGRFVYISSVHAIPEGEKLEVLRETRRFSPDLVVGGYAKTKAAATALVLDAAQKGLDAVVVHPSGILGPYDGEKNHLVQMITDYIAGKLPACVHGGYDFVDVRDVARGCLAAAERGRSGECYILSNRRYEVRDVLRIARDECHGRRIPTLPMWLARAAEPLLRAVSRIRGERPLYTKYSLYTLSTDALFAHDKATSELGYRPRDLRRTIKDTVQYALKSRPKARD